MSELSYLEKLLDGVEPDLAPARTDVINLWD